MSDPGESTPRVDWDEQCALFHRALEEPRDQRSAFLQGECDDAELRKAVGKMLASHESAGPLDEDLTLGLPTADERGSADVMPAAAPIPVDLVVGQVLAGRFEVVRLLGRGGMGSVWEAHDRDLDTNVALKTVRPEIAASESGLQRFRREIHLARQVTHANVCRIFDLFHHETIHFLTMELVEGGTLAERIERDGLLTIDEALPVVEQICAALTAAHKVGVVHRDLKPANIILVEEDGTTRVVVTDFGLARSFGDAEKPEGQLTGTGQILGTPAYMAPEQLGGQEVDSRADVYALGVVVFEMVTGRRPFEGDSGYSIVARRMSEEAPSPRTWVPDLDQIWEGAILRCLEKDPKDRFANAQDVSAALSAGIRVSSPRRQRQRRRAMALVVGAALVAAVGYQSWRTVASIGSDSQAPQTQAAVEPRWVLLADFENATGEQALDGTIEEALSRELSNSRQILLVPRGRVLDTLRLMGRTSEAPLDKQLSREVALRDGEISTIVNGRIESLGPLYLLSIDLVNVADGSRLGGMSEEASDQADILPAIRRLSDRVRDVLGEPQSEIRESARRLERVSTPSLAALQLYSRAADLISVDGAVAAELLTAAIEADPEFAMAHLILAHALRNRGAEPSEYRAHAQRAFELSEDVPDREKYFIRGSYHSMHGRWEDAIGNYATLVRLHPDHQWAGNNLFNTLAAFGRMDEAAPYSALEADSRPNQFHAQARAAFSLSRAGELASAGDYLERARALRAEAPETRGFLESWLDTHEVFDAWLRNDASAVEEALRAVNHQRAPGSDGFWIPRAVGYGYLSIGRTAEAFEVWRAARAGVPELEKGIVAWIKGDLERLSELLSGFDYRNSVTASRREPVRLLLLAMAGQAEEVDAGLEWLRLETAKTDLSLLPVHVVGIVEGAVASAAGDVDLAIEKLVPGVAAELQTGSPLYFLGVELLARAYERRDQHEQALLVLETASAQRRRSIQSATLPWLWIEARRAGLYRSLGDLTRATEVEAALAQVLVLADADFPISVAAVN